MKKQWTLLLVFVLLAAGLGGALWFLNGSAPQKTGESSTGTQAGVTLLQKKENELSSIEVTNQAGGFAVTFDNEKIRAAGLDEAIPLAQSKVESLRSAMLRVEALAEIQQADRLSDFGLEQPRASVKASYRDGSSFTLDIGADAPGDQGVYCRSSEGKVYVFAKEKVSNFLGGLTDLVDTAVIKTPESESSESNAQPLIKQVTFSGSAHAQTVSIERKTDKTDSELEFYRLTAPIQGNVDSEKEQIIAGLLDIRADRAAALNPTAEQLESFGLKSPYSTAEFVYDESGAEQRCVLYASEPQNQTVYLMREGRPIVYAVSSDRLPWLTMNEGDFISTRTLMPNLEELQVVTVATPEKQITFRLSGEKEELKVTCGDKTLDTSQFKAYYQSLIGVSAEEYTNAAPASDTPLLSVTYIYRDSTKQADSVSYFSGPPRRAILRINGGNQFLIREKTLETLLANTQAIQTDGKIESIF